MGKDHELLEAARNGNLTVVEKLLYCKAKRSGPLASLRRGPGVNVQDSSGYTPLHHASLNGHTDVVNILLSHDASSNITDTRGSSALHLAAWAGHYEIVKNLLINPYRPANPNLQTIDKDTPLHCAAQHGHTESLQILLSHGADPNVPNTKGETPLDLAAQYGRLQVVHILINGHPELLLAYRYGSIVNHSPLHLASRNGHKNIVEILITSGIDVNLRTTFGTTALHEAALCGKDSVVLTLLEAGANLDARDSEGRTVIDLLEQFPPHVTKGILSVIKNHTKTHYCDNNDDDHDDDDDGDDNDDNNEIHYPDIWQKRSPEKKISYNRKSYSTSLSTDTPNVYLTMAPIDINKQTPPKKPPRRNCSLSPTYLHDNQLMSMSLDMMSGYDQYEHNKQTKKQINDYEYLFLSKSGYNNNNYNNNNNNNHKNNKKQRDSGQYIEMNSPLESTSSSPLLVNNVKKLINYENITGMRVLNPNRKLRRNKNRNYEDHHIFGGGGGSGGSSVSYLIINDNNDGKENNKKSNQTPMSPTHYNQPPTPEHPPPTPTQAESFIHEIIRPLSQEYKRRSKDIIEIGTSPENLCKSLGASSASLSSSFSLSDRSVSTDCVEEFIGDAPFAGLLKGSTHPDTTSTTNNFNERPTTLKTTTNDFLLTKLSPSSNNTTKLINDKTPPVTTSSTTTTSSSMCVLSPFDEQEEWAKISQIMATFGESLFKDDNDLLSETELTGTETTSKQQRYLYKKPIRLLLDSTNIKSWLHSIGLDYLELNFIENGFDDIDFINGIIDENDYKILEVIETDIPILTKAIKQLPQPTSLATTTSLPENNSTLNNNLQLTIEQWLKSIKLQNYIDTFNKHLYTDMDRIFRIWEVELQSVLDITKTGHRKRILYSIYGTNLSSSYHNNLTADIQILTENLKQMRKDKIQKDKQIINGPLNISNNHRINYRKKTKQAPKPPTNLTHLKIRAPSELLLGFPTGLKTEWRHSAETLISSFVKYKAHYLGSTVVKELRGTESTRKSIQKLKRGERFLNQQTTSSSSTTSTSSSTLLTAKKRPIYLAISFCGVQFIDIETESTICEHEIKNIDCACQDADDLTHFAYITKDVDIHYCHVFHVDSMDLATEVILTLGQAFEVAYQIALRELTPSSSSTTTTSSLIDQLV